MQVAAIVGRNIQFLSDICEKGKKIGNSKLKTLIRLRKAVMGGGASTIMMNSPRDGTASQRAANGDHNLDAGTAALERRLRRQRIFEKGEANPELDINALLDGEYIDDATRKTLIDALGGFYFLRGGTKDPKMDMLLRAMQKEEFAEGFLLITEGEPGSRLYIVDTGELEVTINGEKIRDMSKGSMLGELALLYDAPRSATVRYVNRIDAFHYTFFCLLDSEL